MEDLRKFSVTSFCVVFYASILTDGMPCGHHCSSKVVNLYVMNSWT